MSSDPFDLLSHNRWATARLVDSSRILSEEAFGRSLGVSYPSLAATWLHLLQAEWVWLSRWHGDVAGTVPDLEGRLSPAGLRDLWEELGSAQESFTEGPRAADLGRSVAILTRTGISAELPLGATIQHHVNHATYHRGRSPTICDSWARCLREPTSSSTSFVTS